MHVTFENGAIAVFASSINVLQKFRVFSRVVAICLESIMHLSAKRCVQCLTCVCPNAFSKITKIANCFADDRNQRTAFCFPILRIASNCRSASYLCEIIITRWSL